MIKIITSGQRKKKPKLNVLIGKFKRLSKAKRHHKKWKVCTNKEIRNMHKLQEVKHRSIIRQAKNEFKDCFVRCWLITRFFNTSETGS